MKIKLLPKQSNCKFYKKDGCVHTEIDGKLFKVISRNLLASKLIELHLNQDNENFIVTSQQQFKLLDIKLTEETKLDLSKKTKSEERVLSVLKQAISKNASDIHFIRDSDTSKIKFRVNGKLELEQEVLATDCDEMLFVMYNVMASTKETTWNTKSPQDANIVITIDRSEYRFRYAHMPIFSNGMAGSSYHAVVRVIYPNKRNSVCRDLYEVGLSNSDALLIDTMLSNPSGLVVVSGVTGSGKSTSLKNYMEYLYHTKYNEKGCFVTVEDPVEYIIEGAQQSSVVKSKVGSNLFAEAVRSAMRRDPDVLMIGEIRDVNTGQALSSAVESGHMCLTTVHAGNVVGVLQRLNGLGIELDKLATPDFIAGVMNQKLIPTICHDCATDTVNEYGRKVKQQGPGCLECNYQGIVGRKLVVEYLIPDLYVLKLISEHKWVDIYSYLKSIRSNKTLGQGYTIKDKVYYDCLDGKICSDYFKSSFGHMDNQDEEIIFSVYQSKESPSSL